MAQYVQGIHHITAIAGDPQKNVDFYTGSLGMRLVKKTVNFDAPNVYHLYYGDKTGSPGSILTFFPFPGGVQGKPGNGQATRIHFSVPEDALAFWQQRFEKLGINFDGPHDSPEGSRIHFNDPDGLPLSLTAVKNDTREAWTTPEIPQEKAIKGFHGVTLSVKVASCTTDVLTEVLGHDQLERTNNFHRFGINGLTSGSLVEVKEDPDAMPGKGGSGIVHHVAFRVPDDTSENALRKELSKALLRPTQVIDRQYFHSVYFREPGGVLLEIATDNPGFLIDEDINELGQSLKLPEWEEANREFIEKGLQPLKTPAAGQNETT